MSPKRLRQLMVVLHVLTSVGWLTMSLAQVTLMAHAISTINGQTRQAALTMTEFVDHAVLQPLATTAAFTGLMLSALTGVSPPVRVLGRRAGAGDVAIRGQAVGSALARPAESSGPAPGAGCASRRMA